MATKANKRYVKALRFAAKRHGAVRQARKGTDFPYVIHPIRVAEILHRFGYGDQVVIAGLLHDTVEDAGVSYRKLTKKFGKRVSKLVEKASEPDKSLPWRDRKEHTIERARREQDFDALAVVAADKLDNVRSLQETLRERGEKTWKIFNAGRKKQRWYYRAIAHTILDREPTNVLFQTLDEEVRALFPDEP
jgi:(p)ppGpp synthase/HD superfamily hydrolase